MAISPRDSSVKPLNLERLSEEKALPLAVLQRYGVRNGQGGVVVPYKDVAGNEYIKFRILRRPTEKNKTGRWWSEGEAPLIPYGLWKPVGYEKGCVWIVEGESDCWALWSQGIPAIGVPGAKATACLHANQFAGVHTIVVVKEPDEEGERFPHRVAQQLYATGFSGSIGAVTLPEKDPRALLNNAPDLFRERLTEAYKKRVFIERPTIELPGLNLRKLSSYEEAETSWLWNQRIAIGYITVLAGDGGEGKSFLSLGLAAAFTTGAALPGGSIPVCGDVIIWNAEDGAEDTIRRRARHCGANLDRVLILEDVSVRGQREKFGLRHVPLLIQALEDNPSVVLVVIDPVSALLEDVDAHRDAEVRSYLQPLVEAAKRCKVAILLVMHLNKGEHHGSLIHKLSGSIAFGALPRSVLFAGTHALTGQKSIDCIKHNLAEYKPDPVEFAIVRDEGIQWKGINVDLDAASIQNSKIRANRGSQGVGATEFLREVLSNGQIDSKRVFDLATERGVSRRTLERAKSQLEVHAHKIGLGEGSRWFWSLPKDCSKCEVRLNTTNGGQRSTPMAENEGHGGDSSGGVNGKVAAFDKATSADPCAQMSDEEVQAIFDRAGEVGL